jgi:hypothetical protein
MSSSVRKTLKRSMTAEYSRELSVKVFSGQCRLIELGFRQSGPASYSLRRQLIDRNLAIDVGAVSDLPLAATPGLWWLSDLAVLRPVEFPDRPISSVSTSAIIRWVLVAAVELGCRRRLLSTRLLRFPRSIRSPYCDPSHSQEGAGVGRLTPTRLGSDGCQSSPTLTDIDHGARNPSDRADCSPDL